MSDVTAGLIGTAIIFGTLMLYMLPTTVAMCREHPQTGAIVVLNVLLGWTLLGWAAALVWSATSTRQSMSDEEIMFRLHQMDLEKRSRP